jgi:glycosyltransferase involved in cell wall biosynthesis
MSTRPRLLKIVTVPLSFQLGQGHAAVMSRAGFEVHAVSSPGPLADQYSRYEKVPVHPVPMARRIAPLSDVVSFVRLCRTIRRLRPTVVQAGTPKAAVLGTLAAYLLRVRTRVYYVHGLPMLTAKGLMRRILFAVERLTCKAATHIVCVSPSIRRELIAAGMCPADKAIVLGHGSSNGVDMSVFDPARFPADAVAKARANLGIPADALVIGFLGRIGREKGIEQLYQAWRTIRDEFPSAYLLIIGPDEANDPVHPEVLEGLKADPRVRMTGPDWYPAPLYALMDLLCMPSHREGLPNVALEAAAMEVPVVAFRVPGVVDAVESGTTGELVDPLCAEQIAAAIGKYFQQPSLRKKHGRAGRHRVHEFFAREKVWAALTKFYLSVN